MIKKLITTGAAVAVLMALASPTPAMAAAPEKGAGPMFMVSASQAVNSAAASTASAVVSTDGVVATKGIKSMACRNLLVRASLPWWDPRCIAILPYTQIDPRCRDRIVTIC